MAPRFLMLPNCWEFDIFFTQSPMLKYCQTFYRLFVYLLLDCYFLLKTCENPLQCNAMQMILTFFFSIKTNSVFVILPFEILTNPLFSKNSLNQPHIYEMSSDQGLTKVCIVKVHRHSDQIQSD